MLREDNLSIHHDIELTYRAGLKRGNHALGRLNHLRETRGAWLVVSLNAIFDHDLHGMKFSTSRHLGLAWSAGAATALCVCLLGCKSEKEVADTAPPVATIAAAPTALPSPTGPAWTAAQGEDALTLQALAEAEGATELLRYVRAPGPAQALALQAITFAPDAEIALGGLAEAAATAPSGAGPAHRLALLTAISDIAGRPQAPTELIDPGGVRACAGTMVLLASRSDLSASERAMAKTAARRLARKGYIDPSRVDR